MAQVSQAVLDKINKAEDDILAAKDADTALATAQGTVAAAVSAADGAQMAANAAHATAAASATDAINALKVELGIP